MGKSSTVIFTAVGVLLLSRAALAANSEGYPGNSRSEPGGNAAALAEAYWSDRAGRLPPNRPVITRPAPARSRQPPPAPGGREQRALPPLTLPAGRGR